MDYDPGVWILCNQTKRFRGNEDDDVAAETSAA